MSQHSPIPQQASSTLSGRVIDLAPNLHGQRESEHVYRAIVDHAPIGIVMIDATGEIIHTNQAFLTMLGYSAEEMRAISYASLVPPEEQDHDGERWRRFQALINGDIDSVTANGTLIRKDGARILARISISATRDADDRFLHTVSMVEDVTEQKRLEQRQQLLLDASAALSDSIDLGATLEKVAQVAVQSIADLCIVGLVDDDGTIRRVTVAHADPEQQGLADTLKELPPLTGYETTGAAYVLRTQRAMIYESFSAELHADVRPRPELAIFAAMNIRSVMIVPLIAKERAIGTIAFAYAGPARSYSAADLGVAEDLALRAAAAIDNAQLHKQARDAEDRFRGLVEKLPAMVYVASPNDQAELIYQSPQIAEMIGFPREEWLADPRFWTTRIHPADLSRVLATVESSTASGESLTLEYRFIGRDGDLIWVRDEATLVRNDEGEKLFWLGVTYDITRIKQIESRLRSSERRFRSLIQNAADVTGILNAAGVIQFQSPAVERALGYRPDEMFGTHFNDYIHTDEKESIECFMAQVIASPGQHLPLTYRCRHKDGSWRWLEATVTNFLDDLAIRGVLINARDITERVLAEQQTRESQARFRSAFDDAAVGMAIIGLDGRLLQVNPALSAMTTYSEAELLAMTDADVSHPDDAEIGAELTEQLRQGSIDTFRIEKRYRNKDGSTVWCLVNVAAVRDDEGTALYLLAQVQDISERKELEAQLSHQALHDSLTGLPNRTLMLDRLDREVSHSRRHGGWVAVLFLDLDNFKVINDSLGHAAGDMLLVMVAQRLQACVREEDTISRFGGDEFIIIIGQIGGADEAIDVTTRLLAAMEEPFTISGREMVISPSIGIALGEAGQHHRSDLLRHADIAMYRAKAQGRAGYNLFNAAMHDAALERLELEYDLRRALEEDTLALHYQPVISVSTGNVVGLEALLRWQHPERGLISPAEFIPMAEETGLIVRVGEWVLREACRQAVEWGQHYPDSQTLSMNVNLSARQFQQRDLVGLVESTLADSTLAPERLILELTESVVMEHASEAVERLRALRALGARIAIDDFGTGYSSLAYLQQFPVSILKIDRSFVDRIGTDQDGTPIVSATIGLAQTLGLTIVAEGVEKVEQLRVLRNLGCDLAQGYYFARPLPPGEVAGWLGEMKQEVS